ncbi:hypothetical protein [Nocardia lijiangensis]|uniref:hypothetical protein n=1 Tax=Nocardia lijiangensis TaxID=299618 RepID=UPI003D73CF95
MARLNSTNALNRKESRKTTAIPALISQFDHTKTIKPHVRWAAGNALYIIPAGKEYFEQLAAIVADREFGTDRQMVVNWLGIPSPPTPPQSRPPNSTTRPCKVTRSTRCRSCGPKGYVRRSSRSWTRSIPGTGAMRNGSSATTEADLRSIYRFTRSGAVR